jgi:porin
MRPLGIAWLFTSCLLVAGTTSAQEGPREPRLYPIPPLAAVTLEPPSEAPFGGPWFERPVLSGDWLGTRATLRDEGLTARLNATMLPQAVVSGGRRQEMEFGGRWDAYLDLDGEKLGLWRGLFVRLLGEANFGTGTQESTGSLGVPGYLLEFPERQAPEVALSGLRVQQYLTDDLLVYFGRINTLDDYERAYRGDALGVDGFLNGAFLFPPVLARTVPYVAYAAGVVLMREQVPILSVHLYDTRDVPTTMGLNNLFENGIVLLAESTIATRFFGMPGHQNLGVVYSTGRYTALNPLPSLIGPVPEGAESRIQRQGSWGVFYGADQAIWVDPADPKRHWGVFGSVGLSDGDPNPIRWSLDIGIGGASPLPGRPRDTWGVAFYRLGLSPQLKEASGRRTGVRDESGIEAFYNVRVTPWFEWTPDVQFITPARGAVDRSLNVGLRARILF